MKKQFGFSKISYLTAVALVLVASQAVNAQQAAGKVAAGLAAASNEATTFFDPASKLGLVISGIIGVVGAIGVYRKHAAGDQDASKATSAWAYGAGFIFIALLVLRVLFIQ